MHRAAANAHFLSMVRSSVPFQLRLYLQLSWNGLHSSGVQPSRARRIGYGFLGSSSGIPMNPLRALAPRPTLLGSLALVACVLAPAAHAQKLKLPPGASGAIEKIYSFDMEAGIADARRMQKEEPAHPLGYLL